MQTMSLFPFLLVGLVVTTGCSGQDDHTLSVATQDDGSLQVVLGAPTGHQFSSPSASINGKPLTLVGDGPGNKGKAFDEASSTASAVFTLDAADVPTDTAAITVEAHDGSDVFVLESDTFNAPRSFLIAAPSTGVVRGGDVISTSVDPLSSDIVFGNINVGTSTQQICLGGDNSSCAGCVAMKAAADLSWWCGDKPAPGTAFAAQASATISVQPAVTKCEGPTLSCSASGPAYTATGPIVLQF
jgi:hypothetical protein